MSARTDRASEHHAPPSDSPTSRWAVRLGPPFLLAVLVALAFGNAVVDSFAYDDEAFVPIPHPPGESGWETTGRLFREDVWAAMRHHNTAYRPLSMATLVLDDRLWGGDRRGFHLTSVLLHLLATLALYYLLLGLLRARPPPTTAGEAARGSSSTWVPALVAAAMFAVHPIHTEAVDSVFNRAELLATLAVLCSLLLVWYLEPRRRGLCWALVAVLYLAALFFKESAATLPLLACLLLLFFRAGPTAGATLRRCLPAVAVCAVLGLYFVLRHLLFTRAVEPLPPAGTLGEGLALTLTGLRDNLLLILWPHPLRAVRTDYVAEAVPLAAVLAAALVALVVVARRRARGLAFGLAFFLVALLPVTRLITRLVHAQPMAERYLYLPSVGLAVALAFGVRWLWGRVPRLPVVAAAVVLVGVLTPLTRARNAEWHDSATLFRAEVAAGPANGDALFLCGWHGQETGGEPM
ncbi:MAG: hypothetical protein JXB32_10355 [Deltaproteobacteria bacterium]|nr:hypothetical protein [Deltaproteobacteria bacterium]